MASIATKDQWNGHARPRGDHDLPHNDDAEASILGGILIRAEVLELVDDLETDDFYNHRHKVVFQAIRNLQAVGKPIDIVTLEIEIEKAEKLEAIGGVGFLGELALRVPTADNVVEYASTVRLLHRHRQAMVALASALERARNWKHDPGDLISEVAGELQRFDEHRKDASSGLRWTKPLLDYFGGTEPGDDDAEDWILRDLIPRGEPFLWGGPAKAGKTWAALDLSIALALNEDWLGFSNTLGRPARVLTVLLEDGDRRLHKRLWELCRGRGRSFHDPAILENLRISGEPFYLPDPRDERRLVDEAKKFGADLILADNLTRIMLGESKDERDVKAFARSWKYISDETGAATGFLHHTRKSGSERGGDPFEALRGDGGILGFARHAIVVLPRRDGEEKLSEVHMRGNLDLRREGFVLGFERRLKNDKWTAKFTDRGDIEQARERITETNKEARQEQRRVELESRIEKQLSKAIEIAKRKGHVNRLDVAVAFGHSTDSSVRPAFDLGLSRGVLMKCKGTERNLGYRLPEATQKGLL